MGGVGRMKLHVKTGDTVVILSGKDKGKTGKILQVSPKEQKVIVEGCNMVTKHVKPRKMGQPGGIIKAEGAMYACKVQIVDPKTGKGVRTGSKVTDKGSRIRVTKGNNASGEEV